MIAGELDQLVRADDNRRRWLDEQLGRTWRT
jgi:hypothetical protein